MAVYSIKETNSVTFFTLVVLQVERGQVVRIKCLDPGKVYVTRVPVRCISEEKNDPRARHIICESWGQEPTTTEGNVIGESSPGEMMEKGEHDGKERKEIKRRVGGKKF